jgi:hypothetical protein
VTASNGVTRWYGSLTKVISNSDGSSDVFISVYPLLSTGMSLLWWRMITRSII